tara:strand:- start:685 stop:852 length:168 start_codon:yes stop_codon:yes gene_type:complete
MKTLFAIIFLFVFGFLFIGMLLLCKVLGWQFTLGVVLGIIIMQLAHYCRYGTIFT